MTIMYDGVAHKVAVEPGQRGKERFENEIRSIFGLGPNDSIQLSFGVKIPLPGGDASQETNLEGWAAYDAAVHLASISAGARQRRRLAMG